MKHIDKVIAGLIGCATAVGVLLLFTPEPVYSVPTIGPQMAIENIAPGQEAGPAWAISLDADTNADFLEFYQGDGNGTTGDVDLWPIPHGTRLTVMIRDDTEVTCCFVGNPDQATTTVIGSQAANTTKFEVNGGSNGACFGLIGAGASWTSVVNVSALRDQGKLPVGVCAQPSVNESSSRYSVFGVCAADADCSGDGGHPTGTTCDLTPNLDANAGELMGVYMACRALGATDVDYWGTL